MMMAEPMIDIKGLVKDYDATRAVDHLDLTINKGEIFGLLGPNGAGKTTIILTLLGLSEPTAGSVTIKGRNAITEPISVKRFTGYLPDEVGFSDNNTGVENLIYTALLNDVPREEAVKSAEALLKTVGLEKAKDQKTKTYSKGMIQRLGLADVLIKDPEIIVLDEPTIGIDPKGINEFLNLIRSLSKEKGITVLLSSHLLHQVQKICDRVGLLVDGKLRAQGDINELADELFSDKETSISAEVAPITDALITALEKEIAIKEIQQDKNLIVMEGRKDIAPFIAQTIADNHGKLYQLSYQEHGLDDIYQKYFEGGALNV
ncbi:MAG TPA: ABC transporter ATP-binding protein [Balneolaceae bacterium]|nr:ABC transporter ATP-binding protein [Balneolaceae bacterium]